MTKVNDRTAVLCPQCKGMAFRVGKVEVVMGPEPAVAVTFWCGTCPEPILLTFSGLAGATVMAWAG